MSNKRIVSLPKDLKNLRNTKRKWMKLKFFNNNLSNADYKKYKPIGCKDKSVNLFFFKKKTSSKCTKHLPEVKSLI